MVSRADEAPLGDRGGRIVHESRVDRAGDILTGVHRLSELDEGPRFAAPF